MARNSKIETVSLLEDMPRIAIMQKEVPSSLAFFPVLGEVCGAGLGGQCLLCSFTSHARDNCFYLLGKSTCIPALQALKVALRKLELTIPIIARTCFVG